MYWKTQSRRRCAHSELSLIPETKGRSLEEMDVIFGAVSADKRSAGIAQQQRGKLLFFFRFNIDGTNERK